MSVADNVARGSPLAVLGVSPEGEIGRLAEAFNQMADQLKAQMLSLAHEIRRDESLHEKIEYVCENPVRKGLVATPDEYPWLWREWKQAAFGGRTG